MSNIAVTPFVLMSFISVTKNKITLVDIRNQIELFLMTQRL